MRLFVAVDLSAEVRTAAGDLVDELRQRAARLAPRARITWVAPERMHLTLQFIGEADAPQTTAIERALDMPFDFAPFDVRLEGTGVFPVRGQPRVIWAGLPAGRDRLAALARLVSARLAPAGVSPDDRRLHPHLTLGRVRDAAGLRTAQLLSGLETVELGVFAISAAVLFESRPTTRGHEYIVRRRTLLTQ